MQVCRYAEMTRRGWLDEGKQSRWRTGNVASLVRVLAAAAQAYERARVARCLTVLLVVVMVQSAVAMRLCAGTTGTTVPQREVVK